MKLETCMHSAVATSCKDGGFSWPVPSVFPSRLWSFLCLWHILRHANCDREYIDLWRKAEVSDICKFGKLSSHESGTSLMAAC